MRPVSSRLFLLSSIVLLLGLNSCGGGSASNNTILNPVQGEITTTAFQIPAGQTRTVTSDLTIRASQNIEINGTLLLSPGASLTLLTDGDLSVTGTIQPTAT